MTWPPLKAAARAAHGARAADRYGVVTHDVNVDFARTMQRVHEAQARIAPNDSPEPRLDTARADGTTTTIEGDTLLVATGRSANIESATAIRCVWRRPFADVDRAITDGATAGMVKLVTDRKRRILAGHVLGHGAGNLIGEITLAMKHGITAGKLGNTIHAYPTYPEAVRHAAEGHTKARFTGPVKSIANWFARR